MHEFGIVDKLIRSVEEEVAKRKVSKVKEIHIELGQLMGIQTETMVFLLKEMSKGTILENAKIKISLILPEIQCASKHKNKLQLKVEGHFHDFPTDGFKCPKCGKKVKLIKGNDCIIKKIIYE